MGELLTLAFTAVFIQNIVLYNFLGMCPALGVSKKLSSAVGMGVAVIFTIFGSSIITYGIYYLILEPMSLEYMDLLVFILVIAAFVQFIELFIKKTSTDLYQSLGIFLPLITTNCAVLFVALENIKQGFNFAEMAVYSLAVPVGFLMVLVIFSAIRERLEVANTPKYFKGNPVAMIVLAIMAFAFSGLAGII
ncbi:MAG TPA: electron transport complex subunit RsxA [Erysipelothrix sp.]|nr:electron transport complex subunit RsxA [Erysipelothrix sp.]